HPMPGWRWSNGGMVLIRAWAVSLVLLGLSALLAADAAAPPAADWPQFRGDPALTGVARSTLPAQPKLLWTYEAGEAIESSAAIAGGIVYVGVQPGALIAVDLATGVLRWKYEVSEGI